MRIPKSRQHRYPLLPHWKKGPGFCRWCGLPIMVDGRQVPIRRWHEECLKPFFIATRSADQRQACWERDKGRCAACGTVAVVWEADHIKALALGNREPELFVVANLQTLCAACHKAKSTSDLRLLKEKRQGEGKSA